LSLVVDRACARGDLCAAVEAAVRGGVDWLQVRERALEGRALLAHAEALAAAGRRGAGARAAPLRVLVNRRADVALAMRADGVHLGFDAMAPRDARRVLGDAALLGASAHAPEEIDAAAGLSYVHLAPVFAPLSKRSERAPLGLETLARAAARGVPVLAQGGIDAERARAAAAAGAAGVAVTGTILMTDDPERAARALREALDA